MRTLIAVSAAAALALIAGCGSSDDSFFTDPDPSDKTPDKVNNGDFDQNAPKSEIAVNGTSAACVSSVASAALKSANLVFMYDKSGSMGNPAEGGVAAQKWIPVGTGLKDFFKDAASHGLNASLQFFPAKGDLSATCGAAYSTPLVPITPLTQPEAFIQAIDQTEPQGGTPTFPALSGALDYAAKVAAERVDEKTAVVLVTDGQPGFYDQATKQIVPGCENNDVSHIAEKAKASFTAATSIPTYVIGVGSALTNLNAIAEAGGTKKAFIVEVNDPEQTTASFAAALASVRAQSASCDFSLPPPPEGKTLDFNSVNVVLTDPAGTETIVPYDSSCLNGGWHYDDRSAPKKVELCAASCAQAQASNGGKVSLAFGCATDGAIPIK